MTPRKPVGLTWEGFLDRQVREAEEAGAFQNLPGAGKPIPGVEAPHDELWWVKGFLKREGLNLLPGALELKLEVERKLEQIQGLFMEVEVLREVEVLNERIRTWNSRATEGSGVGEIDLERVLARWRASSSRPASTG